MLYAHGSSKKAESRSRKSIRRPLSSPAQACVRVRAPPMARCAENTGCGLVSVIINYVMPLTQRNEQPSKKESRVHLHGHSHTQLTDFLQGGVDGSFKEKLSQDAQLLGHLCSVRHRLRNGPGLHLRDNAPLLILGLNHQDVAVPGRRLHLLLTFVIVRHPWKASSITLLEIILSLPELCQGNVPIPLSRPSPPCYGEVRLAGAALTRRVLPCPCSWRWRRQEQ